MNNSDKLPTCIDYACFLKQANLKLNISIENARNKYGKYSYKQWNKLLNNAINTSTNTTTN